MNLDRSRLAFANGIFAKIIAVTLILTAATAVSAETVTFGVGGNSFEMEFVQVGSLLNPFDERMEPEPLGGVDYVYGIAKFEVSCGMIEKAQVSGAFPDFPPDLAEFICKGLGPKFPMVWDLRNAQQFVNWLNTSTGFQPAYKVSEPVWETDDLGYDPFYPARNSLAKYFLPNEHEWHKAAFYDPVKQVYYNYATGSDRPPRPVRSGTEPHTAVIKPISVSTAVDKAGGLSPFGTMGQTGNAAEWEESGLWYRDGVEGFFSSAVQSRIGQRVSGPYGFRVVSAPGPAIIFIDCNGDGVVDAGDLSCVEAVEYLDLVLQALDTLPGDLDGDGQVAFQDFLTLAEHFGEDPASYPQGNIDLMDGVTFADFVILAENFGATSQAASAGSVPESSTSLLFLVGVLACLGLQRRHRQLHV